MAKKIEINENWEPVEVEDLDNLFVVIFKHGSFDNGYIEAFDTDDILMQGAYDNLANQYDDCGCDELTKIYLIKIPNTDQTVNMCNTGLFNGSSCDPHVIEATRDLFNRADCEQISCWSGCGLTEDKKKKKVCSSAYCGFTDPALNMKHFNKCMGTDGLGDPADHPHLNVGDTLPNGPVASEGSSEASSGGESGAVSESLTEAKEETLEDKIRSVIAHKETDDWHDGKAYLFEVSDEAKNSNNGDIDPFWIEKFDDDEIDFSHLKVYNRTPEEKEDGKCIATFMLSGGKNGSGNWADYLDKLTETFEDLEEKTGTEPLLYKLDTDICDDVWTAYVFLYDHEDKVQESLNEDLIVIEPNESKEKLTELQDQIKAEKDEKVRKSLLTLMNIYLFQTYKPSDREGSTITDDEWQEISDWQQDELDKENKEQVDESIDLDEAKLDYATQKLKMGALESGARGFNAKAASNEKLQFNRMVCQKEGYARALKIIEDEMIERGLLKSKAPCDKDFLINLNHIADDDYDCLLAHKNLLDMFMGSINDALEALLFALFTKDADLAGKIKDLILETFEITLPELKALIAKNIADPSVKLRITNVIKNTQLESLEEDTGYSHRKEGTFNVPPQIKLLDQKQVEDFIKQLSPEELFSIGYATPIHFYAELDDLFELVKATEFVGYTGMDYRDAIADQTVADHADRVANAQRQIDTYTDGAEGHALNKEGERFSTGYRATNKLALNPVKANDWTEYETELGPDGKPVKKIGADGKPIIKQHIDLSKILFYPEVGSHPVVTYFLDLKDGKGFRKVDRHVITDILYKKVVDLANYADQGFSAADLSFLKKQGLRVDQYVKLYGRMPVSGYKKALELGIDPAEYRKEHPYSNRWTSRGFRQKVDDMIEQDSLTISANPLEQNLGMDRTVSAAEWKPSVRALYSNQIYYLSGKPGTFGAEITEALEENLTESRYTYAKPDDLKWFLDEIRQSGPITIKKIGAYRFANYYTQGHPEDRPGGADWHNGWSRPPLKSPKCFIRLEKQNGDGFTLSIRKSCFDKLEPRKDKLVNKTYNNFDELEKDLDLKILKAFRDRWSDEDQRWRKELARTSPEDYANMVAADEYEQTLRNTPGSSWIQITNTETNQTDFQDMYSKEEESKAWTDFNNIKLNPKFDKDDVVELVMIDKNKQAQIICSRYIDQASGNVVTSFEHKPIKEDMELNEAKRYVKRYYVRPLNIFCGNKEDIIQALIRAGDQNCSVYSLKRLDDHEDVHLLQPSDIIYYYDDHVLYDKNHVQVMDYDLFVKHEEDRKKVGNVDAMSDAAFGDLYDDRATEDDLKDQEVIANYKALNSISR